MIKIFFGQGMDYLNANTIVENHKRIAELFAPYGFEVISTFNLEERDKYKNLNLQTKAKIIVEKDLAFLEDCEICLFDLSIKERNYVGCFFEITYAFQLKKPIYAFVGDTKFDDRIWLVYHVEHLFKEEKRAVDAILAYNSK